MYNQQRLRRLHADQKGINMVDLMMWLVIAALLLVAALQSIGYYQKAAFRYQLENDVIAVGTNVVTQATMNNGSVTTSVIDQGIAATKTTNPNTRFTKALGADGYFTIVANNPNLPDYKAIYSSDARNGLKAGASVVPSGTVYAGVGNSESDATFAVGGNCPATQFKAEYFPNADLILPTKAVLCENVVSKSWGGGAPDVGEGMPSDNFSVRWTKTFDVATAGNYKFDTVSDDGIRVKVDGNLIIDKWVPQGATPWTATIPLTAGSHTVIVEYFERGGNAYQTFQYSPVS